MSSSQGAMAVLTVMSSCKFAVRDSHISSVFNLRPMMNEANVVRKPLLLPSPICITISNRLNWYSRGK
ncbi:unnamed protein product [Calypogeia fissa]